MESRRGGFIVRYWEKILGENVAEYLRNSGRTWFHSSSVHVDGNLVYCGNEREVVVTAVVADDEVTIVVVWRLTRG